MQRVNLRAGMIENLCPEKETFTRHSTHHIIVQKFIHLKI